jgi:phosphonate transport system permease protein
MIAVPLNILPSRKLRNLALSCLAVAATLVGLVVYLGVNPMSLITEFHFMQELAGDMLPPNMKLLWQKSGLVKSLLETLSMAFLGTIFGSVIALFLAFFAATNTSPSKILRTLVRGMLSLERSLPNFIVLLVLLIAVGIGPFAGMLALTVGSVGMFGKLFADAIEHADAGITESIQSVGSTRLQLIRYAILPQIAPSFIANLFYAFDVNLRAAIPLGIFGGGGIGFELDVADRLLHYKDVLAYTIVIIILITGMERTSDWVRRRLLTQTVMK